MSELTITLDDELIAWAEAKAASCGKSLSGYLEDVLNDERQSEERDEDAYERGHQAFRSWRAVQMRPSADTPYPTREELHDRPRVR